MPHAIVVRPFLHSEWPLYRTLRLRALEESPDAFGSTWAAEQARTPQEWATRFEAGATSGADLPLLGLLAGQPSGLAWARIGDGHPREVELFQMWVAPEARGQGLGARLLHTCIAWARLRQASAVRLGVTVGNSPAADWYARAGFRPSGPSAPLREGSAAMAQPMALSLA